MELDQWECLCFPSWCLAVPDVSQTPHTSTPGKHDWARASCSGWRTGGIHLERAIPRVMERVYLFDNVLGLELPGEENSFTEASASVSTCSGLSYIFIHILHTSIRR